MTRENLDSQMEPNAQASICLIKLDMKSAGRIPKDLQCLPLAPATRTFYDVWGICLLILLIGLALQKLKNCHNAGQEAMPEGVIHLLG